MSRKDTELPPGLKTGHSALYLPWNNAGYADLNGPGTGLADALRTDLTDPARWAGLDGSPAAWRANPLAVVQPQPAHEPVRLPPLPAGATPLQTKIYQVFGSLDVGLVPTGYLSGYGIPLVPLAAFDGTLADSTRTSADVWRQALATLLTSRVLGSETLPRLDTLAARLDRVRPPAAPIPIALARLDYAAFRPDAVTAGLIAVQNQQLYDVPGRAQSPYLLRTLFVAGPGRTFSYDGNVSFVFPGNLHVQRGGGALRRLELDFGAGQGYQPAALDQPLGMAFCTAGTYRVKVRASYYLPGTPAATAPPTAPFVAYESQFDLVVRNTGCGAAARYSNPIPPVDFPGDAATDGAKVYVRYGGAGGSVHTQLTKPLIVVEGFDVYHVAPKLAPQGKNYDIADFLADAYVADANGFNFREGLDNVAAYDIVFIDFNNGTDDIRRNAEVFKRVVRWVNDTKVIDPNNNNRKQQNVVLGVSMGGLVARYGLAQLVKLPPNVVGGRNINDPDTRLLATQDTPHQGANVPLGIQGLLRQSLLIADIYTAVHPVIGLTLRAIFPQLDQAGDMLDAPATRQMLLLRAVDVTGLFTVPNALAPHTFLFGTDPDDYRPVVTFPAGGPQPAYRFVAASLGSQCGNRLLAPSAELLHADAGFFLGTPLLRGGLRMSLDVKALPEYAALRLVSSLSVSSEYRVFFVPISVTLNALSFFSPPSANSPSWDGVPGGTFPLGIDPFDHSFDWSVVGANVTLRRADAFCFVPTVSALDVNTFSGYTPAALGATYVGGRSSVGLSWADNFVAQPQGANSSGQSVSNFQHPFFLGRQAHWLFNEMERPFNGDTNPLVCEPNSACPLPQPYFEITGSHGICGTTTYAVNEVPGATYVWSASGPFTSSTANGRFFTLTATANNYGYANIHVVVNTPCPLTPNYADLQVAVCPGFGVGVVPVGTPPNYGFSNSSACVPPTSNYRPTARDFMAYPVGGRGGYTYKWYVGPAAGGTPQTPAAFNNTVFPGYPIPLGTGPSFTACLGLGSVFVGVVVTDASGQSVAHTYVETATRRDAAPDPPVAYPNPADATLTVERPVDSNPANDHDPLTVRLLDSMSQVRGTATLTDAPQTIDTSALPAGIYYLHIANGTQVVVREQIQVE